jgi:phosphoglucosamine mutase
MRLFGSSGIRGLALSEITIGLVQDLGEVLGTIHSRVVTGHDPRTSGPLFTNALISGLLSTGCQVSTLGMVSTPTLGFTARKFDCGVMITASHNPPEYNGLKFINPDGSGFGISQMEEIEDLLEKERTKVANWNEIKTPKYYPNAISEHIEAIMKHFQPMDLKVVVDCGCGAASTTTPYLFRELGCEVVSINCQPDGFFPGRKSEPTKDSLGILMKAVIAHNADLGIAHDGDADRMVAVDEKGNFVGGDALLTLFAQREVNSSIVVPVNASMAVDKVVGDVEVIRTKVGDVFISQKIKEHSADFGGEPSGTWIFPEQNLCPDGIFSACKLAQLVVSEPLSLQISRLPVYPRKKGTLVCPNERKYKVLEDLKEPFESMGSKDLNTQDGMRVEFEDSWALVRASGTEPKIRITVEAATNDDAKTLYNKIYELVKGCVEQ